MAPLHTPQKLPLLWGIQTRRSLSPFDPNGISIESTAFPEHTVVINGQTDKRRLK